MEWISVKERLPDTDRDVLISDRITVYEGWYDEKDNKWFIWIPHGGCISFVDVKEECPSQSKLITHWSDDYNLPS